ncbi:MAG: hypothetical protein EA402_13005 [Planctomycetota bacterium]|nr:MAG: hypothetical protein EA402_13005 [Planctomycetota bacterium]
MSPSPPLTSLECDHLCAWAESPAALSVALGETELPTAIRALIWRLADAADEAGPEGSAAIRQLFADLVEGWNDRLDAVGRQAYAAVFPAVVWRVAMGDTALKARLHAFGLDGEQAFYAAYAARRRRSQDAAPIIPDIVERIAVLSRVTIGADVLLTSLLCQRLHQAFPGAEIVVLGDAKLSGLLGGLPQLRVQPLAYTRRGTLGQRLASWLTLGDALDEIDPSLVCSPDSRLDQLAVLPLVEEAWSYLHWENIIDPAAPQSLARALDGWAVQSLALGEEAGSCVPQVALAGPYVAQAAAWRAAFAADGVPTIAIKLDHGGNPAKALPRRLEVDLLRTAAAAGWRILLDAGFGEEELASSQELLAAAGLSACEVDEGQPAAAAVLRFHGSIAGWAAALSACQAAVAYDSVGHHLAGALGIPLLSLFTGHRHPAFPVAWAPQGSAFIEQVVIPSGAGDQQIWQEAVLAALGKLLSRQ